ncbi:MAG: response regulator transcription factor [Elusimicrobia bacterium]|nr:response regulator transcription factor [Elusimicrobiota bacterium]
MSQLTFWVVQQEETLLKRWEYLLSREGWSVKLCRDFAAFCANAEGPQSKLGIALVAYAVLRGEIDAVRRLKRRAPGLSVILTSPPGIEPEKVIELLDAGADDHFIDTLDDRLLLAKLKAHLRRLLPSMASALDILKSPGGELKLDRSKQTAWIKDGQGRWKLVSDLTPTEFQLLALFLERAGKVLERRFIVEAVWQGESGDIRPGTVDKHIESLRRKLGRCGALVRTVYGIGYGLRED